MKLALARGARCTIPSLRGYPLALHQRVGRNAWIKPQSHLVIQSRNSRPICVLWNLTFPTIASIRIRPFDFMRFKYWSDYVGFILQWDMIFVLQVGMCVAALAFLLISSLLRFESEIFLILNITYYLPGKSKRLPKQRISNNLPVVWLSCNTGSQRGLQEWEYDKSFLPIFSSVSFRPELFSLDAPSAYRLLFP
jgi:hypothetical protein